MLIQEKVRQAAGLLGEFGADCWITFTRESEINGDPTLVFLAPGPVTWHSAFIVSADGRTRAIVGLYDQKGIEDTGAYDKVVGYVTGIKEPLLEYLREIDPKTIAVNYSKDSEICDGLTHGMYLTLRGLLREIGLARRLVSAEKIVSALRERKSAGEIAAMKAAVRATLEIYDAAAGFISPGRTEKEIADFMAAEVERRKLALGLGPRHLPGRLHRARHRPGPLLPDRARRRARPRPEHGFRGQGRRLLLGHAADVLHPARGGNGRARGRHEGLPNDRPGRRGVAPGHEARASPASRSTPSPARSSSAPGTPSSPTPSATRSAASPTTARPSSGRNGRNTPGSPSRSSRRAWSSPSSRA